MSAADLSPSLRSFSSGFGRKLRHTLLALLHVLVAVSSSLCEPEPPPEPDPEPLPESSDPPPEPPELPPLSSPRSRVSVRSVRSSFVPVRSRVVPLSVVPVVPVVVSAVPAPVVEVSLSSSPPHPPKASAAATSSAAAHVPLSLVMAPGQDSQSARDSAPVDELGAVAARTAPVLRELGGERAGRRVVPRVAVPEQIRHLERIGRQVVVLPK